MHEPLCREHENYRVLASLTRPEAAGRSSWTLGAMTRVVRMSLSAAAVLVAASVWILIPPYPPPGELLDLTLPVLVAKFGLPNGSIPLSQMPRHPATQVAWESPLASSLVGGSGLEYFSRFDRSSRQRLPLPTHGLGG